MALTADKTLALSEKPYSLPNHSFQPIAERSTQSSPTVPTVNPLEKCCATPKNRGTSTDLGKRHTLEAALSKSNQFAIQKCHRTLSDVTKHRRTLPNVTTASMHAPGVDDLDTAPPQFEDFQTFFELFSNACAKPFKKHAKTSIQKQRLTSRFYKQSETWLYIFSLPARSSPRERQAGNNKRH